MDLHRWSTTVLLAMLLSSQPAFADSVMFDFNQLPLPGKKHQGNTPTIIESYMEGIYGSDIIVGPGVQAPNNFLTNQKGKNSGISLTFGADPIGSFAVDWGVQKGGSGIIIIADGAIVYQHLLTKSEKKTGLSGHFDPFFFDQPIQTVQFMGMKKTKLTIDNLQVNFQHGDASPEEVTGTASGPSPFQDSHRGDTPRNTGDIEGGDSGGGIGAGAEPNNPPITTPNVFVTGPDIQPPDGRVPEPASLILLSAALVPLSVICRRKGFV